IWVYCLYSILIVKMIGLEFVKKVDPDWKKRLKYEDGEYYSDAHCPVMNGRCRKDDCQLWDKVEKVCGYLKK
ncbi:unnamed protein product, partial [marine sediment metagenome]